MLIGGRLVPGEGTFAVVNPSTGQPFAEAPSCSRAQLDEAVHEARAAFPRWAALPLKERQAMVMAGAKRIEENLDMLVETLVKEQGKPVANAKGEFMGIIGTMKFMASRPFEYEKVLADNDRERILQRRVPLGIVGGITPWNFPPLMAAWKMCEALTTGNVCILKPSPYTPLSTLLMGEVLAETFPAGVLGVVSGGDDVGKWLVEHEDVNKISFTGSTRAGKLIQATAGPSLKRLTLELGGNDAAIVLPDADAKAAATGIFNQAMGNSGQICIAVKRCFVHESKFDEVVGHLAELASKARLGDGFQKGVQYGPINNKMQFERIKELVEDAKNSGAKVVAGGAPLEGSGYFYTPTILTNVAEGTRIVDEEQFGPVLPVMPYANVAEAVQRANATRFGLGASVWGTDVARATEVAGMVEAGTVWVNKHGDLSPDIPFGGSKESGIGRQMGDYTLESHTEAKVIRIAKPKSKL